MTRDARTPSQIRATRSALEARQLWLDAMRLEAPQNQLATLAQNFAAGFKSSAELIETPSTGTIRAAIALVASIVALHWAGGVIV